MYPANAVPQNHHINNSNSMLSSHRQGVLRRERICGSIFLAASGTKAMEMLPRAPMGSLWLKQACGWNLTQLVVQNCRFSVVNLSFQVFPSCFSQLSSTNPTRSSHGVLGYASTSEVLRTGIPVPVLPKIPHTA